MSSFLHDVYMNMEFPKVVSDGDHVMPVQWSDGLAQMAKENGGWIEFKMGPKIEFGTIAQADFDFEFASKSPKDHVGEINKNAAPAA